ncbi:hypothetical protein EVAR_54081_1 [Eumeta japonica]|uniref:Uncharacterized protein n=1 Tax=Eumeta variegata TaxID=151549 RepID=A0A4C1XDW3_EUMVA|nr:hypothetical protein EVAR_54081_1 [Eumeta japonica]
MHGRSPPQLEQYCDTFTFKNQTRTLRRGTQKKNRHGSGNVVKREHEAAKYGFVVERQIRGSAVGCMLQASIYFYVDNSGQIKAWVAPPPMDRNRIGYLMEGSGAGWIMGREEWRWK